MAASLGDLREALTALGVSTSTGSLRGEERRAMLEQRLRDARRTLGHVGNVEKEASKTSCYPPGARHNGEEIRSMSLSDLRGELELRQLSTQTPGLKGEVRRHALLQRLQNASAEILPPQARKLSSAPDMEPLRSSRSSTSSYSAASEFLFYDPESTRDGDPVGRVPTLRFPGSSMAHTAAADRELSGKSSPVSTTPSRAQLESELVELRKQLHESRAHRSQTTGRHLQEAGFDQDLDKLSSAMARLESERQRLLRVVFAHEVVQTTALSGRQSELIQEDAVRLIEQQQQSMREQIHYIKRAIALSQDNQESHQEDSAMEQAIGRIELQLQQYAPTTSSRSVLSSVSVASFGSSPAHSIPPHLPVLTRCRSVPSQLFHETWSELDEEQKLQLHEELRANKSFRIRRGRVCIGNAQATARLEKASEAGGQSNLLAFTRYPPTPADKLGIKALFLEQSQRSVGEIRRVYELALAAEPDHALVLGNYARFLHEKCRDLARADQCFAKALRMDPSCVSNVAAYASFLHHTRRDYDQAESLYAQALQLAPNDPQLLGNYASLLRKQANGSVAQLRQAKDLLTRAVENDSQSITNRLRLCAALEDLGDATSALVHYEQLVREVESSLLLLVQDLEIQTLTPRSAASISQCAHVFGNFANFLLRSRHVDRAKTMYTKALSLQPDDTLLQRNFSLLLRDYKMFPRVGPQ